MVISDSVIDRLVDTPNGTLSPAVFSDPGVYEQELEQVFARMWLFVGHESQIPRPGDYVRSRMGEEQVILTRARDGRIYVLLNSCPHRGNVVCRYDEGNALGFQCAFHGWTFDSTGALQTLPPGSEELYAADLRKEEWGMLSARVETFHGTVWATWDDSAPGLIDYFGGAEDYLAPSLMSVDGRDNGTEVLGGVMKWRVGMNWKVPMPDMDITHGWITHRSVRGLLGQFGGQTRERPGKEYHVWFPEGHTTDLWDFEDGVEEPVGWHPESPQWSEYPEVQEYLRANYAARRQRLGKLAQVTEPPHIFPNMGAVGRIIRVLHPQGPTETEMWSYILVDKDAPPEVKAAWGRYHELRWGPNGLIQKDDMENWNIQTKYSKGHMTRTRLRQNNQLGMSTPSLHGPTTFGLPGMWHPEPTDENYRRYFQRWAEVMAARDWGDLVTTPAR